MVCQPLEISDVLHLQPEIYNDNRGSFFECYNQKRFQECGILDTFVQDNISISKRHVLRGLHFQYPPHEQGKLVGVVVGEVFDVAVDIRPHSPTFGKWVGKILSDKEHNMLYIPKGFAHGFYVLSDQAHFAYKISGTVYNKEANGGIRYDDPDIGIQWPFTGTPILSQQDTSLPYLSEIKDKLS